MITPAPRSFASFVIGSALAGALACTLLACAGANTASPAVRSTLEFTPCAEPASGGAASGGAASSSRDTSTINVTIRTEPAASDSAEVALRVEGETERSTMSVNANAPLTMRLTRGVYDLRFSLAGYRSVSRQIRLGAACTANLSVVLRK